MKFRLPPGLTALGLLYRVLVMLRRLALAQERLADTAELELKLKCLGAGGTVEELREATIAPEGEQALEQIRLEPGEMELRKELEARAAELGWRLQPEDDVLDAAEREGYIPVRRPQQPDQVD